ncbi:MAG: hypothetical protein AAF411_07260, partial [Myxococcota bacterium]
DNLSDAHIDHERACLRVQATLLARHGVRRALAPTTEHRTFYDTLPADPLEGAGEAERTLVLAALARSEAPPFAPHLDGALKATKAIVRATEPFASANDLLRVDGTADLP